jgi:hypothetical protein
MKVSSVALTSSPITTTASGRGVVSDLPAALEGAALQPA